MLCLPRLTVTKLDEQYFNLMRLQSNSILLEEISVSLTSMLLRQSLECVVNRSVVANPGLVKLLNAAEQGYRKLNIPITYVES